MSSPSFLHRVAPMTAWLPRYHWNWLGKDAVAGLAVAAVAIPTAMGYSSVALVPVQVGLYALPAALFLYAIFGSSRQVAMGPTSTAALMSGAVIATLGAGDPAKAVTLTAGVALAAGLWLTVFGLLKLGWVTDFISRPVIVGFSFGLSLTVLSGELPHLLGLPPEGPHFTTRIWQTAAHLGDTNLVTLAIGAVALAALFAGTIYLPRVPWALVLMVVSVITSKLWDPQAHGVEVLQAVPSGLPPFAVPHVGLEEVRAVAIGGLAVAVAAVGEGLSAARIFARKGEYRVNADSEFLGTGMANIGAGLTAGMSVCGSLSRTGTAVISGAKTQISGVFAALVTLLFLLTLTGSLAGVPRVILSAIVVVSVWFLLDLSALRYYKRVRNNDFVAALTGLGGVLLLGPLYGLLAAVGISLLGLAYRSSQVHVDPLGRIPGEKAGWGAADEHPERQEIPGILVLRLDAPLFWANCESTHETILSMVDGRDDVRALVLDLEATGQMDTTTVEMLTSLLAELHDLEVELFIARLHYAARVVLDKSGFSEELGEGRMWHSISQTVKAAKKAVDGQGHAG